MRLRRPCEHGRYEEHDNRDEDGWLRAPHPCPGGEFLADDTLVIEKVEGEWPMWAVTICATGPPDVHPQSLTDTLTVGKIRLDGLWLEGAK